MNLLASLIQSKKRIYRIKDRVKDQKRYKKKMKCKIQGKNRKKSVHGGIEQIDEGIRAK